MSLLENWLSQIKKELRLSRNASESSSGYSFLISILFSAIMFSLALRLHGIGFMSSSKAISMPIHLLMSLTAFTLVVSMYLLKTIIIHLPVSLMGGKSIKKTFLVTTTSTTAILPVISALLVVSVGLLQGLSTLTNFSRTLGSYEVFLFAIGLSGIIPLFYSSLMDKRNIEKLHGISGKKIDLISALSNLFIICVVSAMISSGFIFILAGVVSIPFGGVYIP